MTVKRNSAKNAEKKHFVEQSALPPDERLLLTEILRIDHAIARKDDSPALKAYNQGEVVHRKQMQFHQCPKRNRWIFGGNRSGKTECGAVEALWMLRGNHPFRENNNDVCGWIVSLTKQVQRDVAQRKFLHYLNPSHMVRIVMESGSADFPENGVIDFIEIQNVLGGTSRVGFKSCDQGREKFQGTKLDFVWFDEEPPHDIYRECRMRVLDKCGDLFGTMTPLKGLTWVYNEIYLNQQSDDEVWSLQMEWADNPFLSLKEIQKLSATMSSGELESRRYGRFTGGGGLVYGEFDETVHVIDPFTVPKEWYDTISIDPGLNNPLSAHWYAIDFDGNVYVIAEHCEAGKMCAHHAQRIREICDRLGWHRVLGGYIEAFIDSAANQRTMASEKSVAELFYDNGILVNTKVNKALFAGINRVKAFLKDGNGNAKLFIFRTCVNLIRELKGYFWGSHDAPVKKDDHALDELRYYIMSRPTPSVPSSVKTEVQKDKEKLAQSLLRKKKFN